MRLIAPLLVLALALVACRPPAPGLPGVSATLAPATTVPTRAAIATAVLTRTPTRPATYAPNTTAMPTSTRRPQPSATPRPTVTPANVPAGVPDIASLVLGLDDLPAGFVAISSRTEVARGADASATNPLEAMAHEGMATVEYEKQPTLTNLFSGYLYVLNVTARLSDERQASAALARFFDYVDTTGEDWVEIAPGTLDADESLALYIETTQRDGRASAYGIAARRGQYVAIVLVGGVRGAVSLEDAQGLMQTLLSRMP